jgi:acyl-coenzyme A synthetase/AMP-(fatty) acid ligase
MVLGAPPTPLGQPKPSRATIGQCIVHQGYTLWTSYQPASRFWTFQWIEGGWLLALSVLLFGTTVWVAHRRPA